MAACKGILARLASKWSSRFCNCRRRHVAVKISNDALGREIIFSSCLRIPEAIARKADRNDDSQEQYDSLEATENAT
jgi:hypothetical protein